MLYGGFANRVHHWVHFCSTSSVYLYELGGILTAYQMDPTSNGISPCFCNSRVLTDSFKRLLPGACLLDWATGPSVQAHSQLGQLQCRRRCPCCDWLRKGAGMRSWAFNEPSTYLRIELEKLIWNKHREVTVFANLKKNQRCNLLTY